MIDKEKQFMDQYDEYLRYQIQTVGLVTPILPEQDEKTLLEVIAVIDAELAKIP